MTRQAPAASDQVLADLEESTRDLVQALRERDPRYLEHVERRARALRAAAGLTDLDATRLEQIRSLGEVCNAEAAAMRREALADLEHLHLKKRWLAEWSGQGVQRHTALDVKV